MSMSRLLAADSPADSPKVAERPWAAIWMSSLARVLAACDIIYESVDRPDLADSLEERQTSYREFRGIDRTRPLGMMWTWDDEADPGAIIFLPIEEIDELMKTATFGVVDYHKVNDGQFEIERPGVPYHVLLRSGYALLGEEVPVLQALRNSPERLTRDLKEKYDIVFMLDQKQVPRKAKQVWIDAIRTQFEPWLQPQDDEPVESAVIRRALGTSLIDAIDQIVQDVQGITVGLRIDRRTHQLQLDLILQAEQGSTMSAELNRLVVRRSEFSALINRDASAGLAINWPVTFLGKDLPGINPKDVKGQRVDAGIQVVGSDWGDITLIAGIRGPEATAINVAIPHLMSRMEKSDEIKEISRNIATHRNVALHRIVPAQAPDLLQSFIHPAAEILIGQGKETIWIAAGGPDTIQPRLKAAIDAVEDVPASERTGSVMQGRMSLSKWPKVLPLVDPGEAKAALGQSKDGFNLTVAPVPNGLKIQLTAEEGLLRVIGRHWTRQLDQGN